MNFNGNTTITTVGGDAVLTNDGVLGKLAKHITKQANIPHRWVYAHVYIGCNYQMLNINAAFGPHKLRSYQSFPRQKGAS